MLTSIDFVLKDMCGKYPAPQSPTSEQSLGALVATKRGMGVPGVVASEVDDGASSTCWPISVRVSTALGGMEMKDGIVALSTAKGLASKTSYTAWAVPSALRMTSVIESIAVRRVGMGTTL
jgi:hypothetical protein